MRDNYQKGNTTRMIDFKCGIGYIRCSSVHQNNERQLDSIQLDKVFEEKVSAKTKNRPRNPKNL